MFKHRAKKTKSKSTKSLFRVPSTADDLKTAIIIVSVTINLAIFIGWLALKLTSDYDSQVYSLLFTK